MTQDEKINRRLAPLGLTVKDLTPSELKQAREEQRQRDKGYNVTDGILSNNDLLSRSFKRKGTNYGK